MRRRPIPAVSLAMLLLAGGAGSGQAQSCLSYSDGLGNTTLTCPDGRTGYVHTDPGGVATGMLGTQPFQAPAGLLAVTRSDPLQGVPSAAYVDLPPPPAPPVAPAPPPSSPALGAPPLTPAPALTPLQSQYLQERAAEALRRRREALKAGAFDGRTETPTTAKAKPSAR